MASVVEIIIKTVDQSGATLQKVSKELNGVDKSAQGAAKGTNVFANSIKGMINPANMAIAAVTALALYLRNATKAAAESAQVDAKLAAVLKATGSAAGMTAGDIDSISSELSNLTGIDDEVVKSGAAVLLTFRNIGEDVFPTAMKAAADMSAVMGQDLQASVVQLGKALNDIAALQAMRELPREQRPQKVIGCEVWRNLDWLPDSEKVLMDVSGRDNLAAALNGVFDSQIAGGKRYDLATAGRRAANAAFFESHATDKTTQLIFGIDLSPVVADESTDILEYVCCFADKLKADIRQRLGKKLGRG